MARQSNTTTGQPRASAARAAAGKRQREARKFAIAAARLAADLRCEDILLFDVRGLSDVTDYIMLGTATSDRQIKSVGEDIEELGAEQQFQRFGREIDTATTWLVLDFVDVVVHLFDAPTRAHYDLEMMWGDAPKLRWRRPRTKKA